MTKNLKLRILLVCAVLILAFAYLSPTFWKVPLWWEGNLPSQKISLGLDLLGGMHLLMEVDTDKAVENTVERYTSDLEELLFEEQIPFDHVEKVNSSNVKLQIVDPKAKDRVSAIIDRRFNVFVIKRIDENAAGGPMFYLDIDSEEAQHIKRMAVDQAIETIRNRIDEFGVAEPIIQKHGDENILIQLPGVEDPDRAVELIGKTAVLSFKIVDEDHNIDEALRGNVPVDSEILYQRQVNHQTGEVRRIPYLLKKRTLLTGDRLVNARVRIDSRFNEPYVSLEFDSRGGKMFERITERNVGKRLAIVLDDNVYSAPVIQEKISGGQAQITGRFSMEEARDLAIVLRAGSLPAPVSIMEKRQVGPSLGRDSVRAGVNSLIAGGIAVILFMLIYYNMSGFVANTALIMNVIFVLAALAAFRATLTLPGIAGIVLTVGMAIDANVLIFERTREELRLGKTPRAAIDSGYANAMSSILDANITTLVAAVFLFQFGTGPVKGFAVTLSIGILATLFTALVVTRVIFDYFLNVRRINKLSI